MTLLEPIPLPAVAGAPVPVGLDFGESALLALILVGAFALTALLRRMGRHRAFRRIHRLLPAVQVVLWTAVLGHLMAALAATLQGSALIVTALVLALVGLAALPLLRDVFAGLAFALERRWALGDDVRIGDIEGRIIGLGVRSLRLRGAGGTESAIPYALVQRRPIARLALAALDAPCEFHVHVPEGMSHEQAIDAARLAAALSPFASPRRSPEVFVELAGGGLDLRIRGYVFDRDHEERYRSDVSARLYGAFSPREAA